MFKNIIGTFKSARKILSEAREWSEKIEEREILVKKERLVILELERDIKQLFERNLNVVKRKYPDVICVFGGDMHLSSEQRKKINDAEHQVYDLKSKIFSVPRYKVPIIGPYYPKHGPLYLNRELDKIISQDSSDETFRCDLERISKEIEEERNEFQQINIAYQEKAKEFYEISSELEKIFVELDSLSDVGYVDSKVNSITSLNLQLRLVDIKEMFEVLPTNSNEKKELISAINRLSQNKNIPKASILT